MTLTDQESVVPDVVALRPFIDGRWVGGGPVARAAPSGGGVPSTSQSAVDASRRVCAFSDSGRAASWPKSCSSQTSIVRCTG